MMAKTIMLTEEGLKKLEDELDRLKTVTRKEIAEKIKIARGYVTSIIVKLYQL